MNARQACEELVKLREGIFELGSRPEVRKYPALAKLLNEGVGAMLKAEVAFAKADDYAKDHHVFEPDPQLSLPAVPPTLGRFEADDDTRAWAAEPTRGQ